MGFGATTAMSFSKEEQKNSSSFGATTAMSFSKQEQKNPDLFGTTTGMSISKEEQKTLVSFGTTTGMSISKKEQVPKDTNCDALFYQKTTRSLQKSFEEDFSVEKEDFPLKDSCYEENRSSPPILTKERKITQRSVNVEIPEKLDVSLCDGKERNKNQDNFKKEKQEKA